MKIKNSIFILILAFSLIPLNVFGLFMIYENDSNIEEIMREDLSIISETQIMTIENFCESRKESMEIIAQYSIVQDAVLTSIGKESDYDDVLLRDDDTDNNETGTSVNINRELKIYLDNMLIQRREHVSFLRSISIVNKDFKIVASSETYIHGDDSALSVIGEFDGDFYISGIVEREIDGEDVNVVVAYNGVLYNGELIGYIVEEIDVKYFDQMRTEANMWKDGTLYIIDGNSKTITAGYPNEESRTEYVTTEAERISYLEAWNAIDRETNPKGEFSYTMGGEEYITYYSNINYTDWSIRVTCDLSSHKESRSAYRNLLIVVIVAASLILVVISIFISKNISKPVECFINTLEKVQSTQDYSLRIDNKSRNEIGVIANKVNELLIYIEKENLIEKEQQRHLARKAERDSLTGINNKRAIEEKAKEIIQEAVEKNIPVAVGFIDIDDFRNYNTLYGHIEGDNVIRYVANVLREEIEGEVGRVGGDEFVFCTLKVDSLKEDMQRLHSRLQESYYSDTVKEQMRVECSIGIIVGHGYDIDYNKLLKEADSLMYKAKDGGKNAFYIEEI